MKLLFVCLLAGMLSVHAEVSSQVYSLSLKNTPLRDVIRSIEKQGDYRFFFSDDVADLNRSVQVDISNATIEQILNKVLSPYDLGYQILENNLIIISPYAAVSDIKQALTITGTVTDNAGEPIPGVNIQIKGTLTGTVSDINGKYTINVPNADAILIYSFIGYASQEIPIGDRRSIEVTLNEEITAIDEVVVVGFGSQKKATMTGAVSSVKMSEVLGSRPVTNMAQALSGAVPGLRVAQSSGAPGASSTLSIRGIGAIRRDDDGNYVGSYESPLILVDNVPVSDMSMVNPDDVETVSVLKDAASSAVHGARAAFGVVLITTKKGTKDQKPRISYSNNFTFNSPMELADKASTLQNIQGWMDAGFTASPRGGGQDLTTWKDLLQKYSANSSQYPNGYEVVNNVRYDLSESDIYKEFLSNAGFQQTHNLSVLGGTQRSTYRMSFGYTNQDGIITGDKDTYRRYNGTIVAGTDITSWLNAGAEAMYSRSDQSFPNATSNGNFWGKAAAFLPVYPKGESDYITPGEMLPLTTPANMVKYGGTNDTRKDDIRLVGRLTITPISDLKIIGEVTYFNNRYGETNYNKVVKMVDADKWATAYLSDNKSSFVRREYATDHTAMNFYATYQKTFANAHNLSVMGGFNQEYDYYSQLASTNTDMYNSELPSISGGAGTVSSSDFYGEYAVRGVYYRLNYDFKGKYMIEAAGRYDGSSKFPKDDRFGFFPSFSAGWRVTEESFMQVVKPYLSNLKLRVTWGNIGNQNIGRYEYIPEISTGYTLWADGSGTRYRGMGMPALVSNSFTWEKVETLDFGFDATFFNHRLSTVFDWYNRKTIGMLAPGADLPAVIGATAPRENTADLSTKGWELEMTWRDKAGPVSYHIGFNISDSQTEAIKFSDNETKRLNQTMYEGKKIGEIWGLTTDRYYTEDDFTDYANGKLKDGIPSIAGRARHYAGDIIYKDLDEDDVISTGFGYGQTADEPGDYKVIGNSTARYSFGITGGASWNNFDFSFFLQGVGKRDIALAVNERSTPYGAYEFNSLYANLLDYWTPDNPNAKYARYWTNPATFASYNYNTQTKYLLNGAFFRIKNITLGYTIPQNVLEKVGIQQLRVFVSGENLYTFKSTPKGMEPDLSGQGNTQLQNPFMRMFSMGLNLTF